MEVLHDFLLNLFNHDNTLTSRDIIIMAPDVEQYSAVTEAVFSSTASERILPYTISDRSTCHENPILEALINLLNIHKKRFSITDIMTILEVPAIMKRYFIKPHELHTIQHWVLHAGNPFWIESRTAIKEQFTPYSQ